MAYLARTIAPGQFRFSKQTFDQPGLSEETRYWWIIQALVNMTARLAGDPLDKGAGIYLYKTRWETEWKRRCSLQATLRVRGRFQLCRAFYKKTVLQVIGLYPKSEFDEL